MISFNETALATNDPAARSISACTSRCPNWVSGLSNPQCGQSPAVHVMNEVWWLNQDSNDRSFGQESLVQVTASPRWTTTVPRH